MKLVIRSACMFKFFSWGGVALLYLLALPASADTTIVGKVVGVHDGDTLTLRTEEETLKVRLS